MVGLTLRLYSEPATLASGSDRASAGAGIGASAGASSSSSSSSGGNKSIRRNFSSSGSIGSTRLKASLRKALVFVRSMAQSNPQSNDRAHTNAQSNPHSNASAQVTSSSIDSHASVDHNNMQTACSVYLPLYVDAVMILTLLCTPR